MDGTGEIGPVAAFCAELQRFWRASGRDLPSVAREVRISRAQLYAIVNGQIKRPPDFDSVVRPLIRACGGTDAELSDWRRRHEGLTAVHTELQRRPAPASTTNPSQLPADVDGFTGRADALAALDAASERVVTVTGAAGVGKTSLAVHWAHRAAAGFKDGQLYADLRGFDAGDPVDPADAIRGFLDGLGVAPEQIPPGRDAQAALFRSRTADRRLLIVLDNARDADQVRPLLAAGAAVRTVVTSRDRLTALVAESGARPVVLELPGPAEAIELLTRRIGRPAEEASAEIVAACGRLPLALALAAARVRHTGFALTAVAAELRQPGAAALDGVRTVFSWSYTALSEPAARLFRLLGLVAGADITTAAAAALAGEPEAGVRRALRELSDASLLTEHAPGRYRVNGMLRRYAAEMAATHDPEDDRQAALTRLLDHYTLTAYQAERVLNPTRAPIPLALGETGPKARLDVKAALEWLGTERAVLLSALRQARDEGLSRQAWQLSWALDTFLFEQNRWQDEGAAWAVALSAATAMVDRPAAALAHRFLSVVAGRLERFDEAHEHMRRAGELSRAEGDRAGEAETQFMLSYVCWLQSRPEQALEHARGSLALWAELDQPSWEGKASSAVGWYHAQLGSDDLALPYYERAVALQQRAGDRANEAVARDLLGQACHALGQLEAAAGHLHEGLRLSRELGDPVLHAQLTVHLGDLHQALGDQLAAQELWRDAYGTLTGLGHPQAGWLFQGARVFPDSRIDGRI